MLARRNALEAELPGGVGHRRFPSARNADLDGRDRRLRRIEDDHAAERRRAKRELR